MESDNEELSDSTSSDSEEETPTAPKRQQERTPATPAATPRTTAAGGAAGGGARGGPTPATRRDEGVNPGAAKLPLQIRTLDGKTYKIQARTDWTVKRLKEEFEEWRGEGATQCMLQYRARRLADNDVLSTYRIEPDSVIQANFRSTGG